MQRTFQVGDVVEVQQSIPARFTWKNPNGWVARVIDMEEAAPEIWVEWDSLTLNTLPYRYLRICDRRDDLEPRGMIVPIRQARPATARDGDEDVRSAQYAARARYSLIAEFGRAGERIYQVIKGKTALDSAMFQAWTRYLNDKVQWPFQADIYYPDGWDERQHFSGYPFLAEGTTVEVHGIEETDSDLALIASVRHGEKKKLVPLFILHPRMFSRGARAIQDYWYWFLVR